MKTTSTDLYEIDKIIAKLSTAYDRDTIKYKEVLETLLPRLDAKLKRYVARISKNLTTTTTVPSKLSIDKAKEVKEKKSKVKESKKIELLTKLLEKETGKRVSIINESIGDWLKGLYNSLKDLVPSLKSIKQQLQSLLSEGVTTEGKI